MMSTQPVPFEEVRRRAESLLSYSGSAQALKTDVQFMANVPLSLSDKFHHITAQTMVTQNIAGQSREEVLESVGRLFKALSILEKYGCNLTSPSRPRYWRSVKHNNPVFRATVDAIKGGRSVLFLYGYTNQQPDGLSFPDDVTDPDVGKVAAVTIEVMTLRMELDMLIKGTHAHPEIYSNIIPSLSLPKTNQEKPELMSDAVVIPPGEEHGDRGKDLQPLSPPPKPAASPGLRHASTTPTDGGCNLCGATPSLLCPPCGSLPFCQSCDLIYHRHPSRANHRRDRIQETCTICGMSQVYAPCSTCSQRLCLECDRLYHSHPDRGGHNRTLVTPAKLTRAFSLSLSSWECAQCTTVNEVKAALCVTCERPRLAIASLIDLEDPGQPPPNPEWQCKSCTVVNQGSSILCEVCERPRLATRPSITPVLPSTPVLPTPGPTADKETKWMCQFCTYVNSPPAVVCEVCNLPCKDPPVTSPKSLLLQSPVKDFVPPPVMLQVPPEISSRVNIDIKRQNLMRDEGLKLIHQIRKGEKKGVGPEEVYAALCVSRGSNVNPCDWLKSELPHLLDEICAMAASAALQNFKARVSGPQDNTDKGSTEQQSPSVLLGEGVQLSRVEAKQAWLAAGGDTERAVRQLLRDRQAKMRELRSLGFREASQCEEALRLSGGEVRGALSLLQRPLLEPFHQRIWSDQPEAPIDAKNPDKQRMCRRLLALYELPSWGRCELALSLLQEPDAQYSLEDVIQAVRESQDREFLRRLLNNECPCCLSIFPHSKMQSLTSCQCSVCHECFTQHFTIAVRDKHIRDMVCPVCAGPDINDPEHLDSYFFTLDIQLRDCLDREVYELFHKKLMEHALMKDPMFLWCCHCTFGFIYDGNQFKVTCPTCMKSFCNQCKKPWEAQHQDVSCEQFQLWKRENDPDYQRQGLAGFLRDNGITCPHCRFQYALTKGGCMHFSCSQCRYQFCSGCNNPFHTTACKTVQCKITGLHAHHPRDCLFYLRDWEPARLQALLQRNAVEFNTDPPNGTQTDACGVMEQKDEGGQQIDSPCGVQTQPGQAGLCNKHYREYLVSLINGHTLDPAILYDQQEVTVASKRYQVEEQQGEGEDDRVYKARLLKKLMEVPLGEKVPRMR
nr:E3 ubiquitin-protein ligase RNF31-like [Oncorhynchus nerka]